MFEIWLACVEPHGIEGGVLLLRAPAATSTWVSERFGATLQACVAAVLGPHVDVRVAPEASPAGAGERQRPRSRRASQTAAPQPADDPSVPGFNPRYRFEQFVIGASNRLAHAAALAVAENPGQALNPLFIHAPPGLGKTHLLHAIGNYILDYGPGARVRYTTVEAFTNHFVSALSARTLERFKHAYRDADVLLIDDVQFLVSKARTEEEFFHTFNALYDKGRQLVLTCDRLPRELHGIEERLRERFASGLVADIRPPDRATRLTILRKRAALDRVGLPGDAVLEVIADRVPDNIRALEGALIRVVAHGSLTGRQLDPETAAGILDAIQPRNRRRPEGPSVEHVRDAVARHFSLTAEEITSSSRAARVAWPRQLAMHLARQLTPASLPEIGRAFGGRDHATVHYALRRVADRLGSDSTAVEKLETITAELARADNDRRD